MKDKDTPGEHHILGWVWVVFWSVVLLAVCGWATIVWVKKYM